MDKIRSLFLAANPRDTERLSLDKEVREITAKIRTSDYRDAIELISVWAVRPDDLLQSLNTYRPQIVHFSGHGSSSGEIVLADSSGMPKPVSTSALKRLFTALKDNIRLVILNACYSKIQAEAVTEVIDCAIGMNDQIEDEAAITFIASFYRAVGFGRSVQEAFEQGVTALLLEGLSEEYIPEIIVKKGVDPALIFLATILNDNQFRSSGISQGPVVVAEAPKRTRTVLFTVETDDITKYDADVIGLKYAQRLYGADRATVNALDMSEESLAALLSRTNGSSLIACKGRIPARFALFIDVGELFDFDYEKIREFSSNMLRFLANNLPEMKHLAITIHGVGYGLDETESLRAQIAGFFDAIDAEQYPQNLERITIVEFNNQRAQLLKHALYQAVPGGKITLQQRGSKGTKTLERSTQIATAGRESKEKPHVFVAISPDEQMADIFYYGILKPVSSAGYLCEKLDIQAFAEGTFERIKQRIDTAAFVIAELTTGSTNVAFEAGFALGRNRPTILVAQGAEKLPLDIRGQKCILYNTIRQLEDSLTKELNELNVSSINTRGIAGTLINRF